MINNQCVSTTTRDKLHWLSLRSQDITSTDSPALFGLSPYKTEFELWHEKKDNIIVDNFVGNERIEFGQMLEPFIAEYVAKKNDWEISPMKDYYHIPTKRIGSSFDYQVTTDEGTGILEIKNVDSLQYKMKWVIENGEVIEAPPYIEMQVQHQMLVSGATFAYIAAFVGGNKISIIKRSRDEMVIKAIENRIAKFWDSIASNNCPEPDYDRDSEFICDLNGISVEGKIYDATGNKEMFNLVSDYKEASAQIASYEKIKSRSKAKILEIIGDNEKVNSDTFSISSKMVKPKEIAYSRKEYRNFSVYLKTEKTKD